MKQERNNKWDRVREQMKQGYKNKEKRKEGKQRDISAPDGHEGRLVGCVVGCLVG